MTTLADSETRGSEAATGWVRTTAYTWSASPVSVGTGHILAPRHRLGAPLYRVDRSGPPNHALSLPRMSRLIHQPLPGCPSLASWAIAGTNGVPSPQSGTNGTAITPLLSVKLRVLKRKTTSNTSCAAPLHPTCITSSISFLIEGFGFLTSQGWNG